MSRVSVVQPNPTNPSTSLPAIGKSGQTGGRPSAVTDAALTFNDPSSAPPITSGATLLTESAIPPVSRTYDFELRSSSPHPTDASVTSSGTNRRTGTTIGQGGLATSTSFTRLTQNNPQSMTRDDEAAPSKHRSLGHSSSATTLPNHLKTTSQKLEYYLNWNKGWVPDEGSSSSLSGSSPSVTGVLTPRTRYDRLAQSVSAVPFREEKELHAHSAVAPPASTALTSKGRNHTLTPLAARGARTLTGSASTPALHQGRTLISSLSQASLHSNSFHHDDDNHDDDGMHFDPSVTSSSSFLSDSLTPIPSRRRPALFLPPSEFLAALMPDSVGVAHAVAHENERARAMAERFAQLMVQRKARRKARRRVGGMISNANSTGAAHESDGDDSPDEIGVEHLIAPSIGNNKRKPGLHHGQSILHQIQQIVRTVTEEKDAANGGAAKRRATHAQHDDDDDELNMRLNAKDDRSKSSMSGANGHEVALQTVIQAYMESTGLAGSVMAGGASAVSSGGSGTIKDRDGTSTFTTAKITRDVRLVLDYLKSNPVLKQELFDKIERRQALKRAQQAERAKTEPHLQQQSKVKLNILDAGNYVESRRQAVREAHRRERARQERQQSNKAEIDAYWNARMRMNDMNATYGPEMMARRARENAENERQAHVAWGWAMLSQLIPITYQFKARMKEILRQRFKSQVAASIVPTIRRAYVLNVTSKLNEERALALEKIKKCMVRYIRRWKWRKRREACLNVWKFLTLVKNAYSIRQGLKDSSLRSQIVKLQLWWRSNLEVIQSQNALIELAWNRCEARLIKSWMRQQKLNAKRAAASQSPSPAGVARTKRPIPAHLLGTNSPHRQRRLSTDMAFANTLANFNFNSNLHGSGRHHGESEMERDAQQGLAPKRIPRQQKREVIARFVKKRRHAYRQAMRNHQHVLRVWLDDHKHEIELRKARRELGFRNGVSSASASSSSNDSPLEPPPPPVFKLLPTNDELEHMIMNASKQYVLNKLRGAMNESHQAEVSLQQSATSRTSRAPGNNLTNQLTDNATGGIGTSPTFNPLNLIPIGTSSLVDRASSSSSLAHAASSGLLSGKGKRNPLIQEETEEEEEEGSN